MKFSIILNSRKRTSLLSNLLKNIQEKTSNPDDVEVLISIDEDDEDSQYFLSTVYNRNISWEIIPRDRHLNNRLTRLAKKAIGENILILNDDCEIVDNSWDDIVYSIIEAQKPEHGVYYCRTKCNSVDRNPNVDYCSFPLLSQNAVRALGYFMSPKFPGLGADAHLFRIFGVLNLIIDVPLNIRHILHEKLELIYNPDQTAQEMRMLSAQYNYNMCWNCPIDEEINNILNFINVSKME